VEVLIVLSFFVYFTFSVFVCVVFFFTDTCPMPTLTASNTLFRHQCLRAFGGIMAFCFCVVGVVPVKRMSALCSFLLGRISLSAFLCGDLSLDEDSGLCATLIQATERKWSVPFS